MAEPSHAWCHTMAAMPWGPAFAAQPSVTLKQCRQTADMQACVCFVLQEKNRFTKEGVLVMTSTRHRTQRCVCG
jgi:hypothetical protein